MSDKAITVKGILIEWLTAHGYGGLWNEMGCGCVIEDLMPCCSDPSLCEPGYRRPGDEDSPWYAGPEKVEEATDGK